MSISGENSRSIVAGPKAGIHFYIPTGIVRLPPPKMIVLIYVPMNSLW